MTDVWGWESSEARTRRYSIISPRRKMEALEEMRQFVVKYRVCNERSLVAGAAR